MKKIYTFLLAIILAIPVFAVTGAIQKPSKLKTFGSSVVKKASSTANLLPGEPIYNPAGEEHTYVMDYREAGTWGDYSYKGLKFSIRFDSDGSTVYINTLTPEYNYMVSGDEMSWIKGTLAGNDITVAGGQKLCVDTETGDAFYMLVGSLNEDNELQYEDEYHLTVADDGSISVAEQSADYRIVAYQDGGEDAGVWAILYDFEITPYTPDAVIEPSANADISTYIMTASSKKRVVDVAFDGDKCYVKGVFTSYPNDWIVGNISGNTVTFSAGQLFTHDPVYYGRLGLGKENGYDDSWNTVYQRAEEAAFTLSEDRTTLVAVDPEMCLFEDDFYASYVYTSLYNVSFEKFEVKPVAPATPSVLSWDDDPGYETLILTVPSESVDGEFVNTEWLTYSIMLDGELYTFTRSLYSGISEDMTAIPYDFTDDNWDIISSNDIKRISMFTLDWSEVSVFSTYTVDGVATNSEVSTFIRSGVDDVLASDNESVRYYNLQGIELNGKNLSRGIVIKRQGDKVSKVVIR